MCMGNCAESIPYMSASGIRIFDVTDKKTKWSGTMLRKKQRSYIIKNKVKTMRRKEAYYDTWRKNIFAEG